MNSHPFCNGDAEFEASGVKVIIRPVKQTFPTVLDFKVIFLNLDELDEDPII